MYRPPLDLPGLTAGLPPGWRLREVTQTGSTNADVLAAAAGGAVEGLVLVADLQTAGRGRLDRTWTSPPRAGLTMSLLLRPTVPVAQWGWLPLLAGVALAEAVDGGVPADAGGGVALADAVDGGAPADASGGTARLKWPNDLLLGPANAKAAGILVQTEAGAAVLGIGLNVSNSIDELPAGLNATSLKLEWAPDQAAQAGDRSPVCLRLITALNQWYRAWQAAGGDAESSGLSAAYRQRCSTIGQEVQIATPAGPVDGTAVGIDAAGQLLLACDGQVRTVAAGDVTHVRSRPGT